MVLICLLLPCSSCDIPLSATTSTIDESSGRTLLSYVPPHPEKGTPYHRYTYVLFEQRRALPETTSLTEEQRAEFSVRSFEKEHALKPRGITFFRQIWDQSVSDIFSHTLSESCSRWTLGLNVKLRMHILTRLF